MSLWRGLLELVCSALIGGFVGYVSAILTAAPGDITLDTLRGVRLTDSEQEAVEKIVHSREFQGRITKGLWVAGGISGAVIRLILLLLRS